MTAATTGRARPRRRKLRYPSGAREVLPHGADRDLWLAERRRSLGGSDASLLAGISRYGSRVELYLDKTGRLRDKPQTSAMEWGTLLEPVAVQWLARAHDLDIRPAGLLRRLDRPEMHANPDGIVVDDDGVPVAGVEAKTTSFRLAWEWADEQTPDHAELQAQWCMYVTGLRWWWVIGLIDGRDPQVRRIAADDGLQEMLADLAVEFWRDHVVADEIPAMDGSTSTIDAVRAWIGNADAGTRVELTDELARLLAEQATCTEKRTEAEAAERRAKAAVYAAIGDACEVVNDLALDPALEPGKGGPTVLATFRNDGPFAAGKFLDDEPDLAEQYLHDVPAVEVSRLKAEKPDVHTRYRARVLRARKALTPYLDNSRRTAGKETRTDG